MIKAASRPLILSGGGARKADAALRPPVPRRLAPLSSRPANARGLLHGHRLCVPASPSLKAVRALMAGADSG
ncbi:hypothetical protein ACVOMV_09315 [Mesorhizobium atlanticum]